MARDRTPCAAAGRAWRRHSARLGSRCCAAIWRFARRARTGRRILRWRRRIAQAWRARCGLLRERVPGKVFLGGQSYGGRQSTMLAAEEPDLAAGLLLLSYPLHAPGRPADLRTAHFPELVTPALFVHGTRDPFGSIDQMQAALAAIAGAARNYSDRRRGARSRGQRRTASRGGRGWRRLSCVSRLRGCGSMRLSA